MFDICPKCHRKRPWRGHDACLGHLPGVVSACCGHGKDRGWITWKNGTSIMFDSHDVDVLFEYLVTEAKKDKRESLAEELNGNRNWFIRKMTEYQRTK